jgi:hypothetical protein
MKLQAKSQEYGTTHIFDLKDMSKIENGVFYLNGHSIPMLESTLKEAPEDLEVSDLSFEIRTKLSRISHAIEYINSHKKEKNNVLDDIEQKWLEDAQSEFPNIFDMIDKLTLLASEKLKQNP